MANGTDYTPTLEDLTSADPATITAAAMRQPPPVPTFFTRATARVPADPADVPRSTPSLGLAAPTSPTELGRTSPAVIPNPLPFSRWSLTKQLPATSEPGINPVPPRANYFEASTDPYTGQPSAASPALTKLGKLMTILHGAGIGAAVGSTQPTFGTGYLAAQQNRDQQITQFQQQQQGAIGTELARQNLQYNPLAQLWKLQQTQAEVQQKMAEAGKATAEGQKATAEIGGLPIKQALEQAQTEAAYYKDDPNLGLIDVRTGKPVAGELGMAPLTEAEAAVMGKQPGDRVPLKLKNQASEIANRVHFTTANGRAVVADAQGNIIKDMGVATPMAVINATNPFGGAMGGSFGGATGDAALQGLTPQQQSIVKKVASYDQNPADFRSSRNPKAYADLMARVYAYDPTYDETQWGAKSALRKSFTSGNDSKNIQSLNMVAHHLDLLDKANDALDAGNVQLLNQIAKGYNLKVAGQSPQAVFDAVKTAVAGELGTTFKGASATDPEIASISSTIDSTLSKRINKNVIAADVGLIQGRLKALQFKYEQGMNKPADFRVISPEAEQIFNRLGGGGGGGNVPPPNPTNKPTFGVRVQ